ncbi:hypothetical protein CANARDRAFT_175979 [[Candida] arabinofermentans NRRL YB-2248]|uniref:Protein FYV8 n=1 Tax=[Candida] arabinofermentans NRRL YB-2248 TaxID=983967 RepID=A0A1E4T183_9ASCO|nr:hypothetical protein CANARDRAFT_175979 [[Candida] arabinofermentans NRRL YB-2248]
MTSKDKYAYFLGAEYSSDEDEDDNVLGRPSNSSALESDDEVIYPVENYMPTNGIDDDEYEDDHPSVSLFGKNAAADTSHDSQSLPSVQGTRDSGSLQDLIRQVDSFSTEISNKSSISTAQGSKRLSSNSIIDDLSKSLDSFAIELNADSQSFNGSSKSSNKDMWKTGYTESDEIKQAWSHEDELPTSNFAPNITVDEPLSDHLSVGSPFLPTGARSSATSIRVPSPTLSPKSANSLIFDDHDVEDTQLHLQFDQNYDGDDDDEGGWNPNSDNQPEEPSIYSLGSKKSAASSINSTEQHSSLHDTHDWRTTCDHDYSNGSGSNKNVDTNDSDDDDDEGGWNPHADDEVEEEEEKADKDHTNQDDNLEAQTPNIATLLSKSQNEDSLEFDHRDSWAPESEDENESQIDMSDSREGNLDILPSEPEISTDGKLPSESKVEYDYNDDDDDEQPSWSPLNETPGFGDANDKDMSGYPNNSVGDGSVAVGGVSHNDPDDVDSEEEGWKSSALDDEFPEQSSLRSDKSAATPVVGLEKSFESWKPSTGEQYADDYSYDDDQYSFVHNDESSTFQRKRLSIGSLSTGGYPSSIRPDDESINEMAYGDDFRNEFIRQNTRNTMRTIATSTDPGSSTYGSEISEGASVTLPRQTSSTYTNPYQQKRSSGYKVKSMLIDSDTPIHKKSLGGLDENTESSSFDSSYDDSANDSGFQIPQPSAARGSTVSASSSMLLSNMVKLETPKLPVIDLNKLMSLPSSDQRLAELRKHREELLSFDTGLTTFLKQTIQMGSVSFTSTESQLGPNVANAYKTANLHHATPHTTADLTNNLMRSSTALKEKGRKLFGKIHLKS